MAVLFLLFKENMNLTPLNDRVIVKPLEAQSVTASGIIIPDTASKDRPEQGEVIAVGPGKMLDNGQRSAMSVQVGQKVVFGKYGPSEITINDQDYLVIAESDILAIIN